MKAQYDDGSLWVNHHELDRKELGDIKNALFGTDMLFDHLSIDQSQIKSVQRYGWRIEGDEYEKCKAHTASEYMQSPKFEFIVDEESAVSFHFNFHGQLAGDNPYCGVFVEIDEMPEHMELVSIEVDMKCNDKKKYRQLMREQILTQTKRVCGCRVFETAEMDKNDFLQWAFGVKIFKTKVLDSDVYEMEDAEFEDLYSALSDLY